MSQQFSFPGLEPATPTDRLFFAALPDAQTADEVVKLVEQLRRTQGLRGKPIDAAKLHVTLLFVGDYPGLPRELIADATARAQRLQLRKFTARFDHVSSFAGRPEHHPLVLRGGEGVAGFVALYAALLSMGLKLQRAAAPMQKFVPHMTLLYGNRLMESAIEPIEWQVKDFVLLRSRIGTGQPYEVLGRWALSD